MTSLRDAGSRLAFPAFVALLLAAGVWQCTAAGSAVNGDAISYLDLARQYARGDWGALRNGYWSPSYPLLLGGMLALTGAGPAATLVAAYGVNLAILAGAVAAFAWLLRELGTATGMWPGVGVRAAAWALLAWLMLRLINVNTITPDGLVVVWLLVATALLARRLTAARSAREAAGLGLLLGAGVLVKAALFPVSLIAAAAALAARPSRRDAVAVATALAAVALPWIAFQSYAQGRPTFGETGRLNYGWYVHGLPRIDATPPGATGRGAVALSSLPGAVLLADPAPGTFPFWYDPARWSHAGSPPFSTGAQLAALGHNLRWLRIVAGVPSLIVLALLAIALSRGARVRPGVLLLLLTPAAMTAMYMLVHAEGRLAGPPIVVALVVLLALGASHATGWRSGLDAGLMAVLVLILALDTRSKLPWFPALPPVERTALHQATALRELGVTPGTEIGIVGDPYGHYWAFAAGLRIVLVIPDGVRDADAIARAVAESRRLGRPVGAVVGDGIQGGVELPGGFTVLGAR